MFYIIQMKETKKLFKIGKWEDKESSTYWSAAWFTAIMYMHCKQIHRMICMKKHINKYFDF